MPKGQQKEGASNKPKLSVKEKAAKKAAKKAKSDGPSAVVPSKK